jgi:hypothetical protein
MEALINYFNPISVGSKTAIKRSLVVLALVVAVIAILGAMLEMIGFMAVVIFAVGATVATAVPRWFMLWFQYRSLLIEVSFALVASVVLGGSMAFKAVMLIAGCAGFVSIMKVINLAWKESKGNNTLYEWLLMQDTGTGRLPFYCKLLTKSKRPLRSDFVYDEAKTGPMGMSYFTWSMAFADDDHDFFQDKPPSGKPGWKSRLRPAHKRAEAKVDAEEELQQWKLRKAATAILRRREAELECLLEGPMSLENTVRAGKVARDIQKLREELAA